MDGLAVKNVIHPDILKQLPMTRDPRKTWQYFAQAVNQEEDPETVAYLMQQLYRVLKENGEEPN
jgi:hypothetical protein